jgi:hypothetical protein
MRLTGFDAIVFAEKQGMTLSMRGDKVDEARHGLTVAEAEALAAEDESLIYLDVPDALYKAAGPITMEPER